MSAHPLTRPAAHAFAALLALCVAAGPVAAADPPAKADKPAAKAVARKAPAAMAEAPIPDASPEQTRAAEMVFYGTYDCEFKQTVQIDRNAKHPAYVDVKHAKGDWMMKPVLSSTGAIRLEDVKGETLMLQIAAKSMLLNVRTGQRVVDDCISPKQRELMAEAKASAEAAAAAAAPK
jgi:hypothetical protein